VGVIVNVERIARKKISESIEEQIEAMIASGQFKPGEKLPSVRELCTLFGVGRSSVRDAITALKGKGIVDVKQGEGTFICQFDSSKMFQYTMLLPSEEDVRELFQVRKMLEPGIAEMAAKNRSPEDLKKLKLALSKTFENDWEADYHFHQVIVHAAGNKMLTQFIQFISTTMQKAMIDFYQYIQPHEAILKEIASHHYHIYESIKQSNSKDAYIHMLNHLELVENILQTSLARIQR